jgi:hypothetical protein
VETKLDMKIDLVDLRGISRRLEVPMDTVYKWRFRDLLPEPDYPEISHPIWNWETIEAWARDTGRLK